MNELKAMQLGLHNGYNVRVTGIAQNARNRQPETVKGDVTKVGQSVFYIGGKRYRPYFNFTQVVVAK